MDDLFKASISLFVAIKDKFRMFRLRMIIFIFQWVFKRPKKLLDTHSLTMRAWPIIDVDVKRMFAHAFTRAMVFGRYQLVFESEFRNISLKKRWFPVVASDMMSIYRPIKVFEKFELVSKLVGWNEQRFYAEQIFMVKKQIRARCIVEGVIGGPEGFLNPITVFGHVGGLRESPELPEEFQQWIQLRQKAKDKQKNKA